MAVFDLFLVAGQSNARGFGGSNGASPSVSNGSLQFWNNTLYPLADPVANATNGSAWPAFVNSYGRCAVTSGAVNSSNLVASSGGAGGTWSSSGTGSLFDNAVVRCLAARDALISAGHTVKIRGILWVQGEQDANYSSLSSGDLTTAYKSALIDLFYRFRGELGADIKMWISQTGVGSTADFPRGPAVRQAQQQACTETAGLELAFSGAINFAATSKMADYFHYNQFGYNDLGAAMGAFVRADVDASAPNQSGTLKYWDGNSLVSGGLYYWNGSELRTGTLTKL
jgi:hypothetical protein